MTSSISTTDSSDNDCYVATIITDVEEGVELPLSVFEEAIDNLEVVKAKTVQTPSTPTTIASSSSADTFTDDESSMKLAIWSSWSTSIKVLALITTMAVVIVITFSAYVLTYNPISDDSNTSTQIIQVQIVGNDGQPNNLFPLSECKGGCNNDQDCIEGLICYQRTSNEQVPGCFGGEEEDSETDYCVRPIQSEIEIKDKYDLNENGDNADTDADAKVADEESIRDSDRNDKQPIETTDTPITKPVSPPVNWTSFTDRGRPTLPRDLFLLSGQSNMVGHTTSEQSIKDDGKYWNDIKAILDEAAIAEANGVDDYLSTMEAKLYKVINETNYVDYENIRRVAKTLTNGVMDLYKSSLLYDLDTPLSLGKCSFKEADDLGVYNVSQGTVPTVWNANCGHSFGHELLFSRTLELLMNYTTAFEMHKVARGGSGLYEHWYPNHGQHWNSLKRTIEEGQDYGDWKGFIWHQGSQAAWSTYQYGEDRSLTYLGNLTGLVSEVRELMFQNSINWQCKEEIPVLIVQVGYWPHRNINAAGQRVRDAQAEFCNDDPRAALVQTSDLSRFYHYDAASFLISGNRIAHAYLEAMEGVVECPDRPSESMQLTIESIESDSPSLTNELV